MKIRKLLMISTTVAALTAVSTVSADAASSYASIFGGASFLQQPGLSGSSHTHTTSYNFISRQSVDTSFKTGFVVGGNYGIDWGTFRTELELAYRQSHSGKTGRVHTAYSYQYIGGGAPFPAPVPYSNSTAVVPTSLRLSAFSLMANAWYDFHGLESTLGITPYIGGGAGLAQVKINGAINGSKINEKNDQVFAWQVGAGASLPLSESTSLFVDYRYFAADSADLILEPGFHGGDVKADFDAHTVLIGFRFNL